MIELGFIGLGQMGAAIAERLEADDVRLHLHDPAATAVAPFVARGAIAYPTPRDVADAAPILFACLPNADASLAVARAVADGGAVATYVEMSTIGRAAMEQIAALMAPHGVSLVDAPVSGGPDGARGGRLAMLAAGDPAGLATVRPRLERIAGRLFVVGATPGQGQMMKLVNNLAAAALIAVTTEAMAVGMQAGLDPSVMAAVMEASSGQSSVTRILLPDYVLAGRFDFGATIATMTKDVDIGLAEALALGVPMPAIEAVAACWHRAGAEIGRDRDLTLFARALAGAEGEE